MKWSLRKRKRRKVHPKKSYDPNLSKKIDRRLERNLILYIVGIIVLTCTL